MQPSRIASTERLRQESRWDEASAYREQERRRLRAEGKSRQEANDESWRLMEQKFPPLPMVPKIRLPVDSFPVDCQVKQLHELCAGDPVDPFRDAAWVYEHFGDPEHEPLAAPSPGAWSLLVFAKEHPAKFFERVLPKLLGRRAS